MQYQNFDLEIAEGCARLSFNGSGAPDLGMFCDEFTDLMLRLAEDNAVRVILFVDGDHAFDLHHDLEGLYDALGDDTGVEALAADEEIGRRIITLITESVKPVVAATRGDIRNNGLGFFLAADLKLATASARFTPLDVMAGVMPGWGLTHHLQGLLGTGRALDLLWNRRTLDGQEAFDLGLVDRLLPEQTWEEDLDEILGRLRSLPQPMVHLTKLGLQQAADLDMTTMFSFDWESQQQCWQSLETAEGMKARFEGRVPRFDPALSDEED